MNRIFASLKIVTLAAVAAAFLAACDQANSCTYDGSANTLACPDKTYKTANIGGKVWMAENLVRHDIGGNSYCYGDVPANCEKNGSLYPFETATRICPEGWALPTRADFETAVASSAFNAQKVGFRYYDGKYADENVSASYWTAESFDEARATMVRIDTATAFEHFNKSIAASVRCVANRN